MIWLKTFRGRAYNFHVRALLIGILAGVLCGCGTTRKAQVATGPHFRIVTYNVNRGSDPRQIAGVLRANDADIVCLQEADNFERGLRPALSKSYKTIKFHEAEERVGGGFGFLSKYPGREIAWVPSATGWFDAWIMAFDTPVGPVQVLNVHLKPPISRGGSWVAGYFSTRGERRREMEHFYSYCDPKLPLIVVGDFNDTPRSRAVRFLTRKGLKNALRQFDRRSPTWYWPTRFVTLRRKMDHILYSRDFDCVSARVIRTGPSDHFPVEAIFVNSSADTKN
jgi:endonuclease/exonuclease/phosphatase family metal-dependent hydrolase